MRADEQDHFPFCPIADAVDVTEDDAEKNDLAAEPKHFHQHPKQEVRFKAHLADKRVAKHDGIDFDVTPHLVSCLYLWGQVNRHLHEALCILFRYRHWFADSFRRAAAMSPGKRSRLSD